MTEVESSGSADLLWRVNNEYRRRLTRTRNALDLLERLLLARRGEREAHVLATLRSAQEQLRGLREEQRGWRYAFFYATVEDKRMVHDERDVMRALAQFNRMSGRHHQRLGEVQRAITLIPRPYAGFTVVPGGDLWDMMEYALDDLMDFLGAPGSIN